MSNLTAVAYGVIVNPKTQKLIDAIIQVNSTRMSPRHLYIQQDSRGQVICDNYDNPYGVALIIKDDEYFIHSCDSGRQAPIDEVKALKVAKNFFNDSFTYEVWANAYHFTA